MDRITPLIYGVLVVFIALDIMFFHFIPSGFLDVIVMALGILILLIPTRREISPYGYPTRIKFQWLRKWIFGAALVILGLSSDRFIVGFGDKLGFFTLNSLVGQLILLLIGIIYLLAAFGRTRRMQIYSRPG